MNDKRNIRKIIGKDRALVLDSALELRGVVDWTKAVTLVLARNAYVLLPDPDGVQIHSPTFAMDKPLAVCLNKYYGRKIRRFNKNDLVSKKSILIRDNWTCQYCGKYGNTVDHIYPKSLGGKSTWGNMCCSCISCNSKKDDLTLDQIGYKAPRIPDTFESNRDKLIHEAVLEEIKVLTH
jgi:5-methylcytosine-specific restriction endonuclease McrA